MVGAAGGKLKFPGYVKGALIRVGSAGRRIRASCARRVFERKQGIGTTVV